MSSGGGIYASRRLGRDEPCPNWYSGRGNGGVDGQPTWSDCAGSHVDCGWSGSDACRTSIAVAASVQHRSNDQQRSLTTRSAIAPQKIIYGDTVVSGVISFVGATGDNNRDLYHVIALAGHEVDSIKDIYLDNTKILNADINGGNPAGGDVGGLGIFKVVDSTNVVRVMKHLGDQTAVDSMVSTAFGDDYDDTHIGYNVAYIATRFRLFEGSQKTWDKHTPE